MLLEFLEHLDTAVWLLRDLNWESWLLLVDELNALFIYQILEVAYTHVLELHWTRLIFEQRVLGYNRDLGVPRDFFILQLEFSIKAINILVYLTLRASAWNLRDLLLVELKLLRCLFLLRDGADLTNDVNLPIRAVVVREPWVLLDDREVLDAIIWLHNLVHELPCLLERRVLLKMLELLLSRGITVSHHNYLFQKVFRREDRVRSIVVLWSVIR